MSKKFDDELDEIEERPSTTPSVITNLDFPTIFERALEIFKDQAFGNKDPNTVTIRDLATAKAKSSHFLDALSGIVEIAHQADIISAQKDAFKRTDELRILHSLRKSCELSSSTLEWTIRLTMRKLKRLIKQIKEEGHEAVNPADIVALQEVHRACIDSGQKLIASISRLIQLERLSGSRPWAGSRAGNANISLIEGLDTPTGNGANSGKPPRELDADQLRNILDGNSEEEN